MKFYKYIFVLLALISIGSLSAQKIAYVNETKILEEVKDYAKNMKEIDSLKKDYASKIEIETVDLAKKLDQLKKTYKAKEGETLENLQKRMKPADIEKLESLKKDSELIDLKVKNYNIALDALYKDKVQPELEKVNKTIKDYAKKYKISIVYKFENIRPDLAYVDESLNKTEEIIQWMKKN